MKEESDADLTGQISTEVVKEIGRLHEQIIGAARNSLNDAIRIGQILTRVKSVLRHGQWLDWLNSSVPFSQRTAYNYMTCYARRDAFKVADIANLTRAYGLILSSNGSHSEQPQRLHQSNFYSKSIRLTQALMGDINHKLKNHPLRTWRRDELVSMAAATEPIADLHQRIKALLGCGAEHS